MVIVGAEKPIPSTNSNSKAIFKPSNNETFQFEDFNPKVHKVILFEDWTVQANKISMRDLLSLLEAQDFPIAKKHQVGKQ